MRIIITFEPMVHLISSLNTGAISIYFFVLERESKITLLFCLKRKKINQCKNGDQTSSYISNKTGSDRR